VLIAEDLKPAMPAPAIRVLVVDDQPLFRSGLARLLDEDPRLLVVGEAADGMDAVQQVAATRPEVVLMDLKMPNLDGVAATERIVSAYPGVQVLILTTFEVNTYVIQALRAGASGYVLKDSKPEAIVSSILAVKSGSRVMAGSVGDRLLEMVAGAVTPREFYDGLTGREVEILKLIGGGLSNKQIAAQLAISGKTVRNHVSNMYAKLRISDRLEAVLYALRKGILDDVGQAPG
jgi:DNA-binding NarL/FixJ family response regulator